MRVLRAVFSAMLIGLFSVASHAGGESGSEAIYPAMDFDRSFRHMTQINETSTSRCIGNPVSPICAVETHIAAIDREDDNLLAIAHGKIPGPAKTFLGSHKKAVWGYRILAVRLIPAYMVPPPSRNRFGLKPWDVTFLIQFSNCTYAPCTKGDIHGDRSYLTRKGPYGWFLVGSTGYKYDLTSPPEIYNYGPQLAPPDQ
jgi:hypothetical protein